MTVAVLCASLSTCSFFLFILPSNCSIRQWHIYLVGVLDAFSFACLPFLFSTRACIIQRVKMHFGQALVEAHRIGSAEKLMNKAQCSILPREKLPLCSDLILRSIFPIDLLKFLLILCAMTLAYLFVAYLIYWCIKHWVPHSDITQSSSPLCQCYFHTSLTTTTLPLLLGNNYKCNLEQQQNSSSTNIYTSFSSQPLLNNNKKSLVEEQIPNEPIPSNLQ
uniref:G_PROTEIN_RECEP_F1_2 domain-containing protein n=1 Tax=Meloidogyne incognita TaxID=6306 RepID=A0A914KNY7_MELIC